jgi:hypothetical protein
VLSSYISDHDSWYLARRARKRDVGHQKLQDG